MKKCFKVIMLAFALMLCAVPAFAHNATVTELEGTVLEFGYSTGDIMSGARVYVYDADGEELATGQTNSKGLFDYGEYVGDVAEVTANDGEGHLVTFEVGDVASAQDEGGISSSQIAGIAIVLVIVAAVGVSLKRKKK